MTTSSQAAIRESLCEEAKEAEFRHGRNVGYRGGWDDAFKAVNKALNTHIDTGCRIGDFVRALEELHKRTT